jgi:hypothetical protein
MFRRPFASASLLVIGLCLALGACGTLGGSQSLPRTHPEELPLGRPTCTMCHEAQNGPVDYARLDHRTNWTQTHRSEARRQERVCGLCHQQSFCNDCHTTRVELKPSIKNQPQTYRNFMHRGDYLSRHRIDARVDPTSCFRCHGNPKTSKTCAPCHG